MGNISSLPNIFICNKVTRLIDSECCNRGNYSSSEISNTIKYNREDAEEFILKNNK